jgi:hypothetical protein
MTVNGIFHVSHKPSNRFCWNLIWWDFTNLHFIKLTNRKERLGNFVYCIVEYSLSSRVNSQCALLGDYWGRNNFIPVSVTANHDNCSVIRVQVRYSCKVSEMKPQSLQGNARGQFQGSGTLNLFTRTGLNKGERSDNLKTYQYRNLHIRTRRQIAFMSGLLCSNISFESRWNTQCNSPNTANKSTSALK